MPVSFANPSARGVAGDAREAFRHRHLEQRRRCLLRKSAVCAAVQNLFATRFELSEHSDVTGHDPILFFNRARLAGGWLNDVRVAVTPFGDVAEIGTPAPSTAATFRAVAAVPGVSALASERCCRSPHSRCARTKPDRALR
jgi:hypothetical protein